jgi:hypothetical protein
MIEASVFHGSTPAVESTSGVGAEPLLSDGVAAVLECAWDILRLLVPGLPGVVLLVLSAREYKRRGHFSMEAWRRRQQPELLHEVAVHPGLFDSPEDLLVTLIHEVAHTILWENRKPGDTHCCGVSLSGYYHRTEFRSVAQQLGLEVHFLNRRYGSSWTGWPKTGMPPRYGPVVEILSRLSLVATHTLRARVPPPRDARVPDCIVLPLRPR